MEQTMDQSFEKKLQQLICKVLTDQLQGLVPASQTDDNLLTSKQLAKLLGVKTQTVSVWRTKGIGPAYVKAIDSVRYRYGDVKTWLKEQTVRS